MSTSTYKDYLERFFQHQYLIKWFKVELRIIIRLPGDWLFTVCGYRCCLCVHTFPTSSCRKGWLVLHPRRISSLPLSHWAACRGLGSMFWSLVQDHWLDNLTWEAQVMVPIGAIMAAHQTAIRTCHVRTCWMSLTSGAEWWSLTSGRDLGPASLYTVSFLPVFYKV